MSFSPNFAVGPAAGYTGTTADLAEGSRVRVNGGKIGPYRHLLPERAGRSNADDVERLLEGLERSADACGQHRHAMLGLIFFWERILSRRYQ